MVMVNLNRDMAAEMAYESAMYKLWQIEERLEQQRNLRMVRYLWNHTDNEASGKGR